MNKEWKTISLGEIAEFINGYAFKPSDWEKEGLPIIRIQNLTGSSNNINYFTGQIDKKYKVKNNDLLISWSASLGVFIWDQQEAWLNQHIFKVNNISPKVSKFYLYFSLMFNIDKIIRKVRGSTMKHITKREFLDIEIPLPSLDEQNSITKILSVLDTSIKTSINFIEILKEIKKSLLHHMFTYGPVPIDQRDAVELQETEIGLLPKEWDVKKLGKIASMKSGGTPSRKNPNYWNGDIPWVKTGEINYRIILDTEEKITAEGLENSSARMIPKGTLLIAMYGQGITRGRVGILGIDASLNQACGAIFPCKEILTEYLFFYLSHIYHEIRSLGHGANQRNLNSNIVKSLDIPIQPLAQQKSIVEILRVVDKKVDAEINKKTALEELFRTLLEKLMTGQISVNKLNLEEIQT